jgi:GMP synthase (glutamine-hydrolysing)
MKNQTILVLDFGGQYKELIARRVREMGVYSVIEPCGMPISEIKEMAPIGIILTGGPNSVYADNAPGCDPGIFTLGIPVLGLCYGHQYMCKTLGGRVEPCSVSEYGRVEFIPDPASPIFKGLKENEIALMSHTDQVTALPEGFVPIAKTADCEFAAAEDPERKLYSLQFHPEVRHTPNGHIILRNFVYDICGAFGDYTIEDYLKVQTEHLQKTIGNEKVLLALSGGVDSSVCAALLSRAVPNQLICIFVDHGLMRKNEGDEIEAIFGKKDLRFIRVNAKERFLSKLRGVSDPETKRKIIGSEFISVFEEEARKLGSVAFLAQGTIYPDVIESGANNSANIKSHHNVGGLPENMDFKGIVEPLRGLFKDEVRRLGAALGLPKALINRQPFPGPGLSVRIIGEVTEEKLEMLREADFIFRREVERLRKKPSQYFAVLTNLKSVGVMGDFRTYDYTAALRAVDTSDFMTCEYAKLPHRVLERAASRIVNEVPGISRVVYDITGKPPATIEWE